MVLSLVTALGVLAVCSGPTWTDYASPDGTFALAFPAPPAAEKGVAEIASVTNEVPVGARYGRSWYVAYSVRVDDEQLSRRGGDGVLDDLADRLAAREDTVEFEQRMIGAYSVPTLEVSYLLTGPHPARMVSRFVLSGDTLIALTICTPGGAHPSRANRATFFDSLRLSVAAQDRRTT